MTARRVTCDRCQSSVTTATLRRHKASPRCACMAIQRAAERRGLALTVGTEGGTLDRLGVAVEQIASDYVPGSIGMRSQVITRDWAPRADVAMLRIVRAHGLQLSAVYEAVRHNEDIRQALAGLDIEHDLCFPGYQSKSLPVAVVTSQIKDLLLAATVKSPAIHRSTPPEQLIDAIRVSLSDELRRNPWKGNAVASAGHCYVASEALYHLLGGTDSEWTPTSLRHDGASHWFLRHRRTGAILDPTADQFCTPPPYDRGRGRGFLTARPSKRAAELMRRVSGRL